MNRLLPLVVLLFLVLPLASVGASPPEVRYDLVLIESFDGVAYAYREPEEIRVVDVEASSSLSDRYSPFNLIDGDTATAWVEGAEGFGLGEVVRLAVSEIPRVIGIWPGYQRTQSIFLRNGRPARIRLAFVGNDPEEGDPYYDIFSYEVDLFRGYEGEIAMQPQFIYISGGDILHNMALTTLEYIEIEIMVADASQAIDPDLGISEIRLYAEGEIVGIRAFGNW